MFAINMDTWDQFVWKINLIWDLFLSPLTVLWANDKEFHGKGAGGVSPLAPRQFFKFKVLNGAILALFLNFFLPFLLKK